MRDYQIHWDGEVQKVFAEKLSGTLWVKTKDGIFSYKPEKKTYGKDQSTDVKDHILAPMPGKIKKIFLGEGDAANLGQTILVMEAMKMEFELKSPAAATVKAVKCQVDDQVQSDQILVQLDLPSVEVAEK